MEKSGCGGFQCRAVTAAVEEAGIEAAVEETSINDGGGERRRGDQRRLRVLAFKRNDTEAGYYL
jgi:hypothetical protein